MHILENKTISLRAPEPEDLDLLYIWENESAVWQVSGTLTPFSRYVLNWYLEHAGKDIFQAKQLRLIIQLKNNHRPVGAVDLFDFDPHHRRAGLGILIAEPSDRRHGYARETLETLMGYCFSVLHLHQLYCNIAAGNSASIKLFKEAGFLESGRKREWLYNGRSYEDELLFQKLAGD
ncbi:MAG: GNAT family N-acetyltransferase [Bacteroidales bacterium]|nr:GNAT family N-acetyltransferase [Bacteroidales bacterium]